MKKILMNKYSILIFRLVIGFVFLYAGTQKINSPVLFAEAVEAYKLFPDFLINFIAVFIPWLEIICGLLMILGIAVKENAIIISSLLLIFIILIIVTLMRGIEIDCGCFGSAVKDQAGIKKITENFVLLLMSIVLVQNNKNDFKLIQD